MIGFISSEWQITSKGMFAGSCVGVICLVVSLELLRRIQRSYEGHLIHQAKRRDMAFHNDGPETGAGPTSNDSSSSNIPSKDPSAYTFAIHQAVSTSRVAGIFKPSSRPIPLTLPQQALRALLHMLQFGVAYFIMLLAMYYNGYIIFCILIGAFIGFFIFSWDTLNQDR